MAAYTAIDALVGNADFTWRLRVTKTVVLSVEQV